MTSPSLPSSRHRQRTRRTRRRVRTHRRLECLPRLECLEDRRLLTAGDLAIFTEVGGGESVSTVEFVHDFDTTVRDEANATHALAAGTDIQLAAGHHLVLYNARFDSSGGFNRSEIQSNLNLAGEDLAVGWSQGYMRRLDGSEETFTAGGGIIEVAADGDALQLQSFRTDSNPGALVERTGGGTGVQVLKLDDFWDYFRVTGVDLANTPSTVTGPAGGGFGTTENVIYAASPDEQDAGYTYNAATGEVTLDQGGRYLVLANTYFQNPNELRTGFGQRLALDGTPVVGTSTSVYLRGTESTRDGAAAIGTIVSASPGQALTVQIMKEHAVTTNIVGARTGLTIVRLPDSGQFLDVEDSTAQDFNIAGGGTLDWNVTNAVDAATFDISTTAADGAITVQKDGDYLFFNSLFDNNDGNQRQVYNQRWAVDGVVQPFGQTGRYSRNGNDGAGTNQVNGNWSGILLGLTTGQDVTVTSRQMANSGALTADVNGVRGVLLQSLFGPEVTTTPGNASYDSPAGGLAQVIDTGVTVSTSGILSGAIVEIVQNATANDTLAVAGALPAGISVDGGSTATRLVLTGNASASDYQAALRQVTYSNGVAEAMRDMTPRIIRFSAINDQGAAGRAERRLTFVDNSGPPNEFLWDDDNNNDQFAEQDNWNKNSGVPGAGDVIIFRDIGGVVDLNGATITVSEIRFENDGEAVTIVNGTLNAATITQTGSITNVYAAEIDAPGTSIQVSDGRLDLTNPDNDLSGTAVVTGGATLGAVVDAGGGAAGSLDFDLQDGNLRILAADQQLVAGAQGYLFNGNDTDLPGDGSQLATKLRTGAVWFPDQNSLVNFWGDAIRGLNNGFNPNDPQNFGHTYVGWWTPDDGDANSGETLTVEFGHLGADDANRIRIDLDGDGVFENVVPEGDEDPYDADRGGTFLTNKDLQVQEGQPYLLALQGREGGGQVRLRPRVSLDDGATLIDFSSVSLTTLATPDAVLAGNVTAAGNSRVLIDAGIASTSAPELNVAAGDTLRIESAETNQEVSFLNVNLAGDATFLTSGMPNVTLSNLDDGAATANLTFDGDGIYNLDTANAYDGSTEIRSGASVQIWNSSSLGSSTGGSDGTVVQSGGALRLRGATITESLTVEGSGSGKFQGALSHRGGAGNSFVNGPVLVNADAEIRSSEGNELFFDAGGITITSGQALTIDADSRVNFRSGGVITGDATTVLRIGGGDVVDMETAIPGFDGEIVVGAGAGTENQGRLDVFAAGGLGSNVGGTTVASGEGTVRFRNSLTFDENFTITGDGRSGEGALRNLNGDNVITGTVTLTGHSEIQTDSGTLTLAGAVSGGFNINKTGGGRLDLRASNTFNHLGLTSGIVRVAQEDSLGDTGWLEIDRGEAIEFDPGSGNSLTFGAATTLDHFVLTGGTMEVVSGDVTLDAAFDLDVDLGTDVRVGGSGDLIINTGFGNGNVPGVPDALSHFGYHVANGSNIDNVALDLHGNAGLMSGGDPATAGTQVAFEGHGLLTRGPDGRGFDYNHDGDFRVVASVQDDASGDGLVVTNGDNYANLWLGTLTVTPANVGTWNFDPVNNDDRVGVWIDLDQDGIFESSPPGLGDNRGEQLTWNDNTGRNVNLPAAGEYMVAFVHREGGGGSALHMQFRTPAGGTHPGLTTIDPSAPSQAGFWKPLDSVATPGGDGGTPIYHYVSAVFETNVRKFGAGNVTLGGDNTFSGAVNIEEGTITATHDGAFGVGDATDGIQVLGGAVLLGADVTVDELNGGGVTFTSTLDSVAGGNFGLIVNTSGPTYFGGDIGGDAAGPLSDDGGLGFLTTDAGGTTELGAIGAVQAADLTLNYDASLPASGTSGTWINTQPQPFDFNFNTAATQLVGVTTNRIGISQAYRFDGSGNAGATQASLDSLPGNPTDASATWELWFRPDGMGPDNHQVLFETGASGDGITLWYTQATDTVHFTIDNASEQRTVSAVIDPSEFRQIAAVYTKDFAGAQDLMELYVDGVRVAFDDTSSLLNDWAGASGVGLGRNNAVAATVPPAGEFSGDMAVLRFYERALSGADIHSNYLAMAGPEPILVQTSGNQDLGDAVSLLADAEFQAGGNIHFQGTLDDDGDSGTSSDVVISAAGTTTFTGDVGGTHPLESIDVTTGGPFDLNANLTALGAITLAVPEAGPDDRLTIGGSTIISLAGAIELSAADELTLEPASVLDASTGVTVRSIDADGAGAVISANGDIDAPSAQFLGAGTNDSFQIAPDQDLGDVLTDYLVDGELPGSVPGDSLTVQAAGLGQPTLSIGGDPRSGRFTFGGLAADVTYTDIETVGGSPAGNPFNLVVDLNDTSLNTGGAATDGQDNLVEVQLDNTGSLLEVLFGNAGGAPSLLIAADDDSVNSLTVLGSTDPDTLQLNTNSAGQLPTEGGGFAGLGTLPGPRKPLGAALLASGRTPASPNPPVIYYDGGPGSATDRFSLDLTAGGSSLARDTAYFSDSNPAFPANSGDVNVLPHGGVGLAGMSLSYASVSPQTFVGAGGSLTLDASGTPGTSNLTISDAVPAADGRSLVSGDGGFEQTTLSGFGSLTVRGGAGAELLDVLSLDPVAPPATITLDADDVTGGDTSQDTLRVRSLPAGAVTTLLGGGGNDLFQLFDSAATLDNLLSQVVVDGQAGDDTLVVDDSGSASGDTFRIDETTIDGMTGASGNDVAYGQVEQLVVSASGGDDTVAADFTTGGSDLVHVTLNGSDGDDTINVRDDANLGEAVTGLTSLTVNGNAGNDTFNEPVAPPNPLPNTDPRGLLIPSSTTLLTVNGEDGSFSGNPSPAAPPPTDTIHLDITPLAAPVVVDAITGVVSTAGSTLPFRFNEMEQLRLDDASGDDQDVDVGDFLLRTSDARESIVFTLWNDGGLKVRIYDYATGTNHFFDQHFGLVGGAQSIQKIAVFAGDGDDYVSIAGHVVDGNGDPIPVEFHGEEGDDYLAGASGDDILVGGPGNDRLLGGEGNNLVFGDGNVFDPSGVLLELPTDGDDRLSGRSGNDTLLAGGGNDLLTAGAGDDKLDGNSGDDYLDGGLGNDLLVGGAGNDRMNGYYGHDVLLGGLGADRGYGGGDNDLVVGGDGADYLRGDYDDDTLVAGLTAQDSTGINPHALDAALLDLMTDWPAAGDSSALVRQGDDEDHDFLYDPLGMNVMEADPGDRVYP